MAILCLAAAAHSYFVLAPRKEDPYPLYSSIVQTLRLGMFGDFDLFEYQGQDPTFRRNEQDPAMWEIEDPEPADVEGGIYQYIYVHVVFYLTGIGVTILLMNLLIGVLGQNYELYQEIFENCFVCTFVIE